MTTVSHASFPSRAAAATRFVLAWTIGVALIAVMAYGALWVWWTHARPTVEVHDTAGLFDDGVLDEELESLSFDGVLHIAVLTMNTEATTQDEAKEEIKKYALSHPTEQPWIYEDSSSPKWIWADATVLVAIVPNQNAAFVSHGAFVHMDLSDAALRKDALSPQLSPNKLIDGIVSVVSTADPSLPLPSRAWWQILVPVLLGVCAIFGMLVAIGSILVLHDKLTKRTILLQRLRVLAEVNREELDVITRSSLSSSQAAHLFHESEREKRMIERAIEEAQVLMCLSIPQMSSTSADEALDTVEQQVVTLEAGNTSDRGGHDFLARVGNWDDAWEAEIESVKVDCRDAQSARDRRWWYLLHDHVDGNALGAIPDAVLSECEGVSAALFAGEVDPSAALGHLRRCDERIRRWILVDIARVMKDAGYSVPTFNERFDDKLIAIEDSYSDSFGGVSREELMRYRLADAPPRPVAGCAVAHYVSCAALVQGLDEWARRPDDQ